MKDKNQDQAKKLLDIVQMQLLTSFPFYGRIAVWLKWVILEQDNKMGIPYAATDGVNIYWNRKFLEDLLAKFSPKEARAYTMFVAVHEIHHVIKKHHLRIKDRDPDRWNRATDYGINWELKEAVAQGHYKEMMRVPSHMPILLSDKFGNMLEEKIYEKIPPEEGEGDGNGIGGIIGFPGGDSGSAEQAMHEADLDAQIEAAAQEQAKRDRNAGYLSGSLRELIAQNKQPQVNWRSQLRRFISPHFPTDVSWATFNRRLLGAGMYYPGIIKDGVGKVAIGIDTSGSIQDAELSAFLSEMKSILTDAKPEQIDILWFHSRVWCHQSIRDINEFEPPASIESGGTHFPDVFNKIQELDLTPKCLVMLTDGYSDYPEEPYEHDTIWCCTTDYDIPFGEVCRLKI